MDRNYLYLAQKIKNLVNHKYFPYNYFTPRDKKNFNYKDNPSSSYSSNPPFDLFPDARAGEGGVGGERQGWGLGYYSVYIYINITQ